MDKKVPEIRFEGFVDDWEQRKLGEVASVYDGTHQTPNYVDKGVMFLSVEDISTLKSEKFISEAVFLEEFKVSPERGDILMTRIGNIGTTNVVRANEKLAYYVSLALLKTKDSDSDFLSTLMQTPTVQKEIWERTLHVAFPKKINKSEIEKVLLHAPNKSEQAAIGNFFHTLDDTIALHQEKLEALKKMKTAYLDKIFSQEIRFSGFCGTWEQRKLGEVAGSSFGGGTPSTANDAFWNGDIPWLQSSDLTEHDIMQVNLRKHITQKGLEGSAAKLVPAKSIAIVTRVGVGKLGIIPFQYTTSQDFLSLSNFNVDIWFGGYMIYNKLQKEVNSVQGTSIKGITKEELLNKTIKVPPTIPEQTAIGNFFRNIDDTIALHHQKIDSLHKLKHAYLQKMFS